MPLERRHSDGTVVLEVEGSAVGSAEAEPEKVFTPVYRATSTMHANQDGTGPGLAIMRDIAPLHRAAIALSEASAGNGLKVSIAFPAAQQQDAASL